MIRSVIESAHRKNRKVGICGQAPSDYPEFAEFLVRCGIDSISLNPDSFIKTVRHVALVEGDRTDPLVADESLRSLKSEEQEVYL